MTDRHALRPHAPQTPGRPEPATAGQLLARILDEPGLPAQVQALEPAALAALIERIGLEDAGELIALATTAQLVAVFDEDLWRNSRPGEDEQLDPTRFVRWLEVLQEAGDAAVARRLAELPEELVTLGLHQQVLVLDVDALAARLQLDDDPEAVAQVDRALDGCLAEELDGYQLVARRHDGWDAVLAAILALDRDQHALLVRILDRCVAMDADEIEDQGGLQQALAAAETAAEDAAGARDDRRGAAGYVSPSSAAAFLKLAAAASATPDERDPITRAYFREVAPAPHAAAPAPAPAEVSFAGVRGADLPGADPGAPGGPDGLRRLLAEVAISDDASAEAEAEAGDDAAHALLGWLRALAAAAPARFAARQAELAYLANVLVAGATIGAEGDRRRVRPVEALRAAAAIVARGLALVRHDRDDASAIDGLAAHAADALFRRGWARLHHDAAAAGHAFAADDLELLATSSPAAGAPRHLPHPRR